MVVQQVFFQGRNTMSFNFPTERLVPMAEIEVIEKERVGGLIMKDQEFTVQLEILKDVFFSAVSGGLGWAINNWPEISKISGPYDGVYRIDCVCKFDSQHFLKSTEVETCFMVPENAFLDALCYGLKRIMGNVYSVSVKNIWSSTDSADVIITFKAKGHE